MTRTFVTRALLHPLILCLALLCLVLAGCGSGSSDNGGRPGAPQPPSSAPPAALNSGDVTPSAWRALPAAGAVPAETQAARDRILGPGATDPSQVKVWWYGVSSFIASIGGHLVLFDAWEVVGLHKDYVPIGRDDLAALRPEAIFIGHGHFDHAADAGYIAGRTGAALVGGSNVCLMSRQKAAKDGNGDRFPCLVLGNNGDLPAGHSEQVKFWRDLPEITIIKHIHSAADPMDLLQGGLPMLYVPELLTYLTHLNTSPAEIAGFLTSLTDDGGVGEPTGGTWAYHFRIGDFSLLWHDSSGPIAGDDAEAVAVREAIAGLPGCVDVQLGAIVGFGMLTSGMRDVLAYVDSARPQLFIPNHHDAWAPVIGGGARAYESGWNSALATLAHVPEQDYLRDPDDYLKVRSFAVKDARWRQPPAGSRCAATR